MVCEITEQTNEELAKEDIISLLKKQCVPKIDLWKMCFEKHLPEDFSNKYHLLEKRRNQVAHNKLLTNASFHEVLALCYDVKDTLQEAHSKFCQEYISEEEQILIDEYIPTILGGGTKLFEQHDVPTKLKLKSTQHYNGMVDLVYERV